jgi:hypothetical protein
MREIRTSGSMSGLGKPGATAAAPRLDSTHAEAQRRGKGEGTARTICPRFPSVLSPRLRVRPCRKKRNRRGDSLSLAAIRVRGCARWGRVAGPSGYTTSTSAGAITPRTRSMAIVWLQV